MIHLIPYAPQYQQEFKRLNMEWLETYNVLETHDVEILDDPEGIVLEKGGCIFLALDGEKVVGTAGLYKESETDYELIKMAVDPPYRGKGISRILMEHCLEEARKRGARKLFLFSNSQLKVAIQLYQKYGFKHVDPADAPFVTADVKMELMLE